MTGLPRNESVAHGSRAGFLDGCRSRGGCRWHGSAAWLTCVEASIAVAGDARLRRLPAHVPVPRERDAREALLRGLHLRHGTVHGFRRGCRDPLACPNRTTGLPTCRDAARAYRDEYLRRRGSGDGSAIEHGTLRGYHGGCRDACRCPGDAEGRTCTAARREHRLEVARTHGALPRDLVDAGDEAARRAALQASGMSVREIARTIGIGRTTVGALLAAVSRGDVPHASSGTVAAIRAMQDGRVLAA